MNSAITNKYDFAILFDVENSNPNGDPDSGNMPRTDIETGHGIVTDCCIKRKIRNYVEMVKDGVPGHRIYIKENVPLNRSDAEAYDYVGVEMDDKAIKAAKATDAELDLKLRDFMCGNFFDIRAFGAVMTTFTKYGLNCGQVKGPVQIGFARSIDPITPQEITITRQTQTTEKDLIEKGSHTMGNKFIVPYGLYRCEGHISANQAQKVSGFSEEDLELLWDAIMNMFEEDFAAARGKMAVRELIIFKHDCMYGNAPSHKLFDLISIKKKDGVVSPRSYSDYEVTINTEDMPEGVTCIRKN